jgi:uncharacterized protein (UPF0548 family)
MASPRAAGRLSQERVQALRREPFTYTPVGATRAWHETRGYPSGFHHLHSEHDLGRGDDAFRHAAATLMTWGMHTGAGMRVAASSLRVSEGVVVLCRLGPLRIPCRVVWVLDEPDRQGFGYGTLPGHPESGEESFVVRRDGDRVTLTVGAYSRPGLLVTRLAGSAGRLGQRLMVRRYAAALRVKN